MDMPDKKASDLSTFFRVLRTNQKKWWIDIFGLFGAMALGSTFPMFALYFGEIVDAFVLPAERVLPTIHLWAGLILLLGFIAGIGGFIKASCCMLHSVSQIPFYFCVFVLASVVGKSYAISYVVNLYLKRNCASVHFSSTFVFCRLSASVCLVRT